MDFAVALARVFKRLRMKLARLPRGAATADALAAGKMEEQLKTAAEALEAFIGGQPKEEACGKSGIAKVADQLR